MRRGWLCTLLLIGLVLAGCVSKSQTYAELAPVGRFDLDAMMYGPPPGVGQPTRQTSALYRVPLPVHESPKCDLSGGCPFGPGRER